MRNASDADDAVQECYLRAFRHFDTFRGGPIKPWLMAILRNVCHAVIRRQCALGLRARTDADAESANPIWRENSETPEQAACGRHKSNTMRRLIGELPAEFREVIVLREINDLSYRDIAVVIEAPIGTVMSRLARARGMLRDAWVAAEGGSAVAMNCERSQYSAARADRRRTRRWTCARGRGAYRDLCELCGRAARRCRDCERSSIRRRCGTAAPSGLRRSIEGKLPAPAAVVANRRALLRGFAIGAAATALAASGLMLMVTRKDERSSASSTKSSRRICARCKASI